MHRWNCSRFTYDGLGWHEQSVSTLAAYREGARLWAALDVFRCPKDEVVVRYDGTVTRHGRAKAAELSAFAKDVAKRGSLARAQRAVTA